MSSKHEVANKADEGLKLKNVKSDPDSGPDSRPEPGAENPAVDDFDMQDGNADDEGPKANDAYFHRPEDRPMKPLFARAPPQEESHDNEGSPVVPAGPIGRGSSQDVHFDKNDEERRSLGGGSPGQRKDGGLLDDRPIRPLRNKGYNYSSVDEYPQQDDIPKGIFPRYG